MARCQPANQDTAKTKTTQGNDYRTGKWVIVMGNDLFGVLKNKLHSSE